MEALVVENLQKTYPDGTRALKGVSVRVDKKEFVGLIGLSGSGKSTLLRCINRLVEPDSGKVFLEGIEITSLGKRELRHARRKMGMIFQEFNLVEKLTVIQNILSGRLGYTSLWRSVLRRFPEADVRRAVEISEVVGIRPYLYKRADELSGGQRQRVGIARALIQDPRLLLVDEPTSSLDPAIGHDVMNEFHQISKKLGVPVLISIHDVNLALEYADRIVAMRDGTVVSEGRADEFDQKRLEEVYRYKI
ncbi:MAG: phosphonate ABC transporter ATP-binding protein [Deltaproteobacteria bacterium]|nr:phosphonate ABC transporter ATP-binding protein [Deltaproteobacteria bacterium]MBW2122652.1 phosphonate ABC transporter ATP-binding protein [Deltaproteobacteria bacterium]